MYGATAGQVGILRFEAATNQAICGILPSNHFVAEFLFYFLLSRKDALVAQAAGNAQPNISQVKIRNTDVPIVPLSEQRRIVGILGEAFEGIATPKPTPKRTSKTPAPSSKATSNPSSPGAATGLWKPHGEEIDLLAGFAFKSAQYTNSDNSVRLLRGDNIVQGALRWDDVKKWPDSETAEYSRYQLRDGDVVLAMDRPWVKAGLKTRDDFRV